MELEMAKAKAKTYYEKLLDPRWQKKRLEILNREDFTCEACGSTENTLHVHHGYYERNLDPWDYESSTLSCLCDLCHDIAQVRLRDVHYEIALVGPNRIGDVMCLIETLHEAYDADEAMSEITENGPIPYIALRLLLDSLHSLQGDKAAAEIVRMASNILRKYSKAK